MQSHRQRKASRSPATSLLLGLIRGYIALLSPFLGGACKFYPSCSNYAYEAISRHGAGRGAILALRRIGRCHPFRKGGFDPVPEREAAQRDNSPGSSHGAGVRSR